MGGVAAILVGDQPPSLLEDALGDDAAAVLPELIRLGELRVRVPRYAIVLLEAR